MMKTKKQKIIVVISFVDRERGGEGEGKESGI